MRKSYAEIWRAEMRGELGRKEKPMGKPDAIICDLDGTIAVLNGRDPYDASSSGDDTVNHAVLRAVSGSVFVDGSRPATVLFTSGRQETDRKVTELWLTFNVAPFILAWELFMRPTDDTRPDVAIKQELYQQQIADRFNVLMAFDDRDQIVSLWRSLGIPTFQVREGGF